MRNRTWLAAGVLGLPMLAAGAAGLGVMSPASASERVVAQAEATMPKLVVVKLHADWCAKCKSMELPFAEARAALVDEPVLFVRFDFTDQSTARQSEYLASLTGYDDVWETYMRQTGFAILVDAETGEMIEEVRSPDAAAIETAIRDHL